jgi:6-phospho-3-hexuloisomerase
MRDYQQFVSAILSEIDGSMRSVAPESLDALRQSIQSSARIYVVGKGRSGLYMRAFAMRLMHLGLSVHVIDDVTTPGIREGDLLIIGSGSGGTASLVNYAEKAKKIGAQVALITAAPSSPIGEKADHVIHISAPTPKTTTVDVRTSIQPMANLFEQTLGLLLDIVTMQLMDDLKINSEQMFARHANLE